MGEAQTSSGFWESGYWVVPIPLIGTIGVSARQDAMIEKLWMLAADSEEIQSPDNVPGFHCNPVHDTLITYSGQALFIGLWLGWARTKRCKGVIFWTTGPVPDTTQERGHLIRWLVGSRSYFERTIMGAVKDGIVVLDMVLGIAGKGAIKVTIDGAAYCVEPKLASEQS